MNIFQSWVRFPKPVSTPSKTQMETLVILVLEPLLNPNKDLSKLGTVFETRFISISNPIFFEIKYGFQNPFQAHSKLK